MFYKEWKSIYKKIVKDFNFNIENDEKAAQVLNALLENRKNLFNVEKFEKLLNKREVVVYGAGPSLKNNIIRYGNQLKNKVIITANGATTALLENKIFPDIIVTDLDGNINDQIKANSMGSIAVIHAHGDNIDKIKKFVMKFKGKVLGTTQINPISYKYIYNFGGFTDGDRAVYLASHFKVKKINLVGFDFNGEIGEYSFSINKDIKKKLKKLKWCEHLIIELKKHNIIQFL
jgi:uncharacterized Rossmann fold enzyme